MTLRARLICILIFGGWLNAFAINATTTHTVFYKKNTRDSNHYDANIVLSWRAQNSSLHFKKNTADNFESEIVCIIRLSNDTGIYKDETFIIKTPPKATPAEAYNQIIADQYEYVLPEGNYTLELALYEPLHKEKLYQFEDTFRILRKNDSASFLSGIQLLDTFFASDANTIYSRNRILDLSLGSNYLDEKREVASIYFEAYNLNKLKSGQTPATIRSYISWKPYSTVVPKYQQTDTLPAGARNINFHRTFAIGDLPSGNYHVNVELRDNYGEILDKKTLFIQRFSTKPKVAIKEPELADSVLSKANDTASFHVLDLTNTFVGKYNASQVRAILKMLLLICDPIEGNNINGFLKKPDELYSKYFIFNFWEKRDKQNPEKAWKAYAERIKEVNKLFTSGARSGYETDRGRIYIQYGKPNDRIIVNNETGALPYEVWQYYSTEKQGREAVFLFYQPGKSLGGYELVHSTAVGEKRNTNWRALLYNNSITGSGTFNADSRAEQYIGNK